MYYNENSYQLGLKHLRELTLSDNQACMIFVAEASEAVVPEIRAALSSNNVTYVGGIFPSLITDGEAKTNGFIITTVPLGVAPILLDLSALHASNEQITQLNQYLNGCSYDPLMMVISSNSMEQLSKQNDLATFLRGACSNKASYMGGCAGSISTLRRMHSIFDRNGTYDNAAVLIAIDKPSYAAAEVGWSPVGNAHIVTSINDDGTIIKSVNNRNASSWFIDEYRKLRNQELLESDINFASNIQIGFFSYTGGHIVRAVIGTTPDGGLILGGTIPPRTTITLMDTNPHIIRSKVSTMIDIMKKEMGSIKSAFVVECVTRPVILADQFSSELQSIENTISNVPISGAVGFVSIGEFGVVSNANHVDLLNVSIVLAVTE